MFNTILHPEKLYAMKKLIFVSVLLVLISACKKENEIKQYWEANAIYEKNTTEPHKFQLYLDNDDILYPEVVTPDVSTISDKARVNIVFSVIEELENTKDYSELKIELDKIFLLPHKELYTITDAASDTVGNDPVTVKREEDIWFTRNYLNVVFDFLQKDKTHDIDLVTFANDSTNDDGRYILELRHNSYGDEELYTTTGYMSFNMSKLHDLGLDEVPLVVKVFGKSDTLEWEGNYEVPN